MIRLVYTILSLLPWYAYALIAYLLGSAAVDHLSTYRADVAEAERAILAGPPPVRTTDQLDRRLRNVAFDELHVTGTIRADLGIGLIEGTVPKTYIVLDTPDRTGPVLAVLFVGTDRQTGLTDLVAASDPQGRVTALGFRRTLDWQVISDQLRVQGVRREVLVMEAIVGDRATALRAKAASDLPFIAVLGGLAALSAVVAAVRFSRWKSAPTASAPRTEQRQTAAAGPVATAPAPARAKSAAVPTSAASPWARGTVTRSASFDPPEDVRESPTAPFKSVFPGGGSGFRFKTADEIIRQSFGTVSTLDRPKPAKPKE